MALGLTFSPATAAPRTAAKSGLWTRALAALAAARRDEAARIVRRDAPFLDDRRRG